MELFNVKVYNPKYNRRELHLLVPADSIQNGYLCIEKMGSFPIEEIEFVNCGQLQRTIEYVKKDETVWK